MEPGASLRSSSVSLKGHVFRWPLITWTNSVDETHLAQLCHVGVQLVPLTHAPESFAAFKGSVTWRSKGFVAGMLV